jgi:hypothetical protein
MSSQQNKCARCRQPLPESSGFCIACGHSNDLALLERKVKVTGQADDRIGFARALANVFRAIGGIFRGPRIGGQ